MKLSRSALLVIDMQNYFLTPHAPAYIKGAVKIVPNIIKLMNAFKKIGAPVFLTRHAHIKGRPTGQMGRWWNQKLPWEGSRHAELIDELKNIGENLITKTRYSAFIGTALEKKLLSRDIKTLVIAGVMTHLCVESTARHAFLLDFQPIIVSDACASEKISYHKASLLNLAHGFAYILKTRDVLSLKRTSKNRPSALLPTNSQSSRTSVYAPVARLRDA